MPLNPDDFIGWQLTYLTRSTAPKIYIVVVHERCGFDVLESKSYSQEMPDVITAMNNHICSVA